MKTLKSRLNKEIKNIYLVQGDDFYLFEKAEDMIKKACNLSFYDFNFVAFDEDNFSAKKFIDSCQVLPIGDEKRLIFLKGISKISDSDKKMILSYANNPVNSTVVVVLDYSNNFDFLKQYSENVSAKRMERELLVKLIVSDLAKEGKKISMEGVECLIDSCNSYLTKIKNEILKLVCYCEEELITKAMVDEIVIKEAEYNIFELTEALSKKDGDKTLKVLSLMEKEPGVFSVIANHFRRMFYISISDITNKELAEHLGVKEFAILKARNQAKAFSKVQLKNILNLLEKVDYYVKSGNMQQINALYYFTFNVLYI